MAKLIIIQNTKGCHDNSIAIFRGIMAKKQNMTRTEFPEENSPKAGNTQPDVVTQNPMFLFQAKAHYMSHTVGF
jgi:hypothetical protein